MWRWRLDDGRTVGDVVAVEVGGRLESEHEERGAAQIIAALGVILHISTQ